jgi:release factor glutamine methyltransferase
MKFPHELSAFQAVLTAQLAAQYEAGEVSMFIRIMREYLGHAPQSESDWQWLEQGAARLLNGEPIQHIIGRGHFYGREFRVGPEVLIPRGETEELMVWVREEGMKTEGRRLKGVDLGTGSGCIPISLYLEWKSRGVEAELTGVDVSEEALVLARQNAEEMGAKVLFVRGNVFEMGGDAFSELDFVVSNPPYVPERERGELKKHVAAFDPGLALFVPDDDPLVFYRRIVALSRQWLRVGGKLFVEIHRDFGKEVVALFEAGGFVSVELRKDMHGNDRMVMACQNTETAGPVDATSGDDTGQRPPGGTPGRGGDRFR